MKECMDGWTNRRSDDSMNGYINVKVKVRKILAFHMQVTSWASINSLPTVALYCNITRMTVKIADEVVKTMCCVLRFISPAISELQTSSKKQWIALGFA